jgi:uncharacterized membrane protein
VLGGILWFVGLIVMWNMVLGLIILTTAGAWPILLVPVFYIAATWAAWMAARAFNRRNAITVR